MRVRFDRFYTYAEIVQTLDAWAKEIPSLCRVEPIGQSYEGRNIPMILPIWSPTVHRVGHQPSGHARIPRSRHMRAYSPRRSSAPRGIGPRECEAR